MKTICFFLTILVAFAILVGCADTDESSSSNPADSMSETLQISPIEDFQYEENKDGGITITRYVGQNSVVTIPNSIGGKPVTQIGFQAFITQKAISQNPSSVVVSLQMPDTVTIINDCAFEGCDQLERITFSENLTQIGAFSFKGCERLKHVTIPSSVRQIGDEAFADSGLETIIFENGIEKLGGYGAFARTQLKHVTFPSTVKEVGMSAFAACPKLESIILNEGLVTIGHKAFCANQKLKEIEIPKTVRYITEMDFTMCSSLEKIMFAGDAPTTFEYSDTISGVWDPYDVHFKIYYHETAEGFSFPSWYGYPTELW